MTSIQPKIISDVTDWMTETEVRQRISCFVDSCIRHRFACSSPADELVRSTGDGQERNFSGGVAGSQCCCISLGDVFKWAEIQLAVAGRFRPERCTSWTTSIQLPDRRMPWRIVAERVRSETDGYPAVHDHRSIKQALCCHTPLHQQMIKEQTAKMMKQGLVEPPNSEWSFDVVLVKKEDK